MKEVVAPELYSLFIVRGETISSDINYVIL